MIKRYCDCCGELITTRNKVDDAHSRLTGRVRSNDGKTELGVEVLFLKDGCANAGDWCKYCILDALMEADDRPRVTPSSFVVEESPGTAGKPR